MKIVPHADCYMISTPTKFRASNLTGGYDISIRVVDCGVCQFASIKTITVRYLSRISILLHKNCTTCRLLYGIDTSKILRFGCNRGMKYINYSGWLWYMPIHPLSKPLQLNISAAFQYYCIKIEPLIDCYGNIMPAKYRALNRKWGWAISISVVDCCMCHCRCCCFCCHWKHDCFYLPITPRPPPSPTCILIIFLPQ